jgi:NodT family efflux transporter outer membrane factor (OMF) lipoprotein
MPSFGAVLTLALAGCAVGPDFTKPAAPDVSAYTTHPLPSAVDGGNAKGGGTQNFAIGADLTGDWWTLFHSKPLNDLIAQALANNPDLKAAQAALRVAKENVLAQRGAFFPSLAANFSATRQAQSGSLAPVPETNAFQYNLFTPQVSVSYEPDVFGLNRRTVESLEAQQDAVRYQMAAAYTTLTTNLVAAAIQEAATQAQIAAIHQVIDAGTQMVQILQYQLDKGYANGLDLAAQKAQLAQANAMLPPLVKQSGQLHDLLADLTGRFPSQADDEKFDLSSLQLPTDLPVSLPSKLVEQRPDVLQAEANLHAASAEIGIAVANRLPNLQLTAGAGSTGLTMAQLFKPGTEFWSLGASLTAPIFEGGTLLHREDAARAAYDQAAEQYRSTVLAAFQNVADTLTALEQDGEALKAASAAADAAKVTMDLTQIQLKDGYVGNLAFLNAEQAYQQALTNLVQAQSNRFSDTVALFQALGGGWWHRTDLADNDTNTAGDSHAK